MLRPMHRAVEIGSSACTGLTSIQDLASISSRRQARRTFDTHTDGGKVPALTIVHTVARESGQGLRSLPVQEPVDVRLSRLFEPSALLAGTKAAPIRLRRRST